MLRNKTAKIVISILASFVVAFSANTVLADVGFKVGGSSLNLGASENLIYGLTGSSGSDSTSNFLLFEKGAGNSIFKINYGGNIGIGNSNPQYKLDVNGDINFTGALRVNGNVYPASQWSDVGTGIYYNSGHVGIGTTNPGTRLHVETNQGAVAFFNSKLNGGNYAGYIGNGQTSSGEEFGLYYALDDSRLAVYDFANSKFLYGDGLIINNNTNNVGIGADPAYRLDAVTTSSDAYYRFQAGGATQNVGTVLGRNGLNQWYMYSPANTTDFRISGLAVTDPFTIKDTTGYVGIGTNAPQAGLHVSNGLIAGFNTGEEFLNVNSGNDGTVKIGDYTGFNRNTYFAIDDNNSRFIFLNGNVGIGTTSPAYKLQIASVGTFGIDTSASTVKLLSTDNNQITLQGYALNFNTNGANQRMIINATGKVGIGTTTPTTATLVIGNSSTNYSIDAGNYRIGNVATPVSNLDAVNKSYVDSINSPSGPSTSTAGYWTGNGANGIYNNNSGNVGIGTTNPGSKLQVSSTGNTVGKFYSTQAASVLEINGAGVSTFIGTEGGGTLFPGTTAGASIFGTQATSPIQFISNNSVKMTIQSDGNVGIGTTSPFTKLQVFGGAAFGNGIQTSFLSGADFQIQKNNGNNTVLGMWQYGVASSLIGSKANDSNFYLTNNYYGLGIGTASTSIAITNTGNAGIGYASPGYRLDTNTASGDAYNRFMASSATQNVGTVLGRNGLNQWYMYSPANTTDFRISGLAVTDPFTIKDTTGNVGIATTNPGHKLEVNGAIYLSSPAQLLISDSSYIKPEGAFMDANTTRSVRLGISDNSTVPVGINMFETNNDYASTYINFRTGNADVLRISNLGNVGIGTTAPSRQLELSVPGAVGANGIQFTRTGGYGSAYITLGYGTSDSIDSGSSVLTSSSGDAKINLQNKWYSDGSMSRIKFYTKEPHTGDVLVDRMIINEYGNVGIGVTAPGYRLDTNTASGDAYNRFMASSATQNVGTVLGRNGLNQWYMYSPANTTDFRISGLAVTDPFTIKDTTGYVGVGLTNPAAKLDVYGSARIGQSANSMGKTLTIAGNLTFDPVSNTTNAQVQGMGLANGGAGSIEAGTYYYAVVFSTAEGDTGVAGLTFSGFPSITFASPSQVNITNIPTSTDPRVTSRKIYRSQAGTVGDYYYLYNIGTIANNTATTYTDNSARNTTSNDWMYNKNNTTAGIIYRGSTVFGRLGDYVTAFGNAAMGSLTRGSTGAAFGSYSLSSLTTGDANHAFGHSAGASVTSGANNNYFGYAAGLGNQTGSWNVAMGYSAVRNNYNYSASYNIGIGGNALGELATGNNYNTGLGHYAGANSQATGGTYVGSFAGYQAATTTVGNYNTILGYSSGRTLGSGASNVIIGNSVELSAPNTSNQLNIGNVIYATGLTSGSTPSASGKMGIGTTTPTTATLVIGTSSTNYSIDAGNYRIGNVATPISNLDAANKSYVDSVSNPVGASTSTAGYWTGNGSNGIYNNNSGNVGIGTTNPEYKLSIFGAVNASPIGYTNGYYVNNNQALNMSGTYMNVGFVLNGNGTYLRMDAAGKADIVINGDSKLNVNNNGQVGIGVTAPGYVLDTNTAFGDAYNRFMASGATQNVGTVLGRNGLNQWYMYSPANTTDFRISGLAVTDPFTIKDTTGYVGIGTTTPSEKLHVIGNAIIGSAGGTRIQINANGGIAEYYSTETTPRWRLFRDLYSGSGHVGFEFRSGSNAAGIGSPVSQVLSFHTAGSTERMRINGQGLVGIGTTAPTTAQLVIGTSSTNYTLDAGNYRIGNVAAPVSNLDAVNKTYVDSIISSSSGSGIFTSNINLNNNNILNVNKITVNTIDPLYNIGGINYSSFAASVVGGVKEEYSGRAKLNNKVRSASGEREYEKVLDFDRMEKGSDLWVWRQVVDFSSDNIEVVATPSGARASIYYIIEGNHLIFRADRPVDISYRLTGRRFDWRNWPTRALDQTEKAGFIIQ